MNKYALILPLTISSFFFGYFESSLKLEYFCTLATITTILVAVAGCLLFIKSKKAGDSKRTRKTKAATVFVAVLLFLTLLGVQLVNLVEANPILYNDGEKPPDEDTKPPIVSIASPESNTVYNTNTVDLTFNVSVGESTTASSTWIAELCYKGDWQENKTYVDLAVYYAAPYVDLGTLSSKLPPMFSFNITDIPDGKHSITVYATEQGHYVSYPFFWDFYINASASVNFIIDTISPAVTVLSVENRTYSISDVPLDFTVNETPSWIGYSLDKQANNTITGNATLTGVPDGSHCIVIYAEDLAGNTASSELFYFTVDTTLPNILLLTIENRTYDTTYIPLNFTVNEPVSELAYVLDGQSTNTITGNMTLTELSDGSHNLTVYAKDAAGNIGNSETVYFSVHQPPKRDIFGSSSLMEYDPAIAAVIVITVVAMASYLFVKHKKLGEST